MWWEVRSGAPEFAGVKITQDLKAAERFGLVRVRLTRGVDRILVETPGVIGWGGNSGFQALNILAQRRPRRIVLVGYDLQGEHWHGRHRGRLTNPTPDKLARWAGIIDAQAPLLNALGIEVLNASPTSALTAFPKVSLEDALAC